MLVALAGRCIFIPRTVMRLKSEMKLSFLLSDCCSLSIILDIMFEYSLFSN